VRRMFIGTVSVLALLSGIVVATAGPASAAANITATSVALNAGAGCDSADLDLGMVSDTVDNETGLITNAAGETLGQFDQPSSFSGYDGVFDGYGQPVSPDQPEGTVIGSYASIGTAPLSAATAAEWFVLYQCGSGGNTVLLSCFGDLGACPGTAVEALALTLEATLDPSTVSPGGSFTVNGTGCFDQLAGAVLFDGDTPLGVGDTVTPSGDGTFSIPLVVPANVAAGTTLTVQVDCGNEQVTVSSLDLPLQVVAEATTTTTAPAAQVTPAFTG
jgi:hypothetical protein